MRKIALLFLTLVLMLCLCSCACKHENWKSATCTTPKTCANCGEQEGAALGHNWKSATCTTPKTCTNCGEQEGSALGHSWKSATCTSAKKCTVCNKQEGAPKGHSYKDGKCTSCGAADPKYTQLNWRDIFTDSPNLMTLDMNSVGGIGFAWEHNYTGGKAVNYITITYTLLDAVGNPIKDDITNKSTHSIRIVGPWAGNKLFYYGIGANFDALVYCKACHSIRFDSILLEYADGTFGVCTYGWKNTVH